MSSHVKFDLETKNIKWVHWKSRCGAATPLARHNRLNITINCLTSTLCEWTQCQNDDKAQKCEQAPLNWPVLNVSPRFDRKYESYLSLWPQHVKENKKILGNNFNLVTTLQKYICWWVKKKLELSIFHHNVIYFQILMNVKHILGGMTFFFLF